MEPQTSAWVQSDASSIHPSPTPTLRQVSSTLLADGRGRRRRRDARRLPPPSPQSLPPSSMPPPQPSPRSECATIDATALSRPLSPDALHGTRCTLAPSPPPPPSISKARHCRSRHPRRRHRPCHHLGRNCRRNRVLRRVGRPFGPSAPSVKKKWACKGHFSGPLWN